MLEIKTYLVTQKPIPFENILIHQLSFEEILNFGIEQFNQLLIPYLLTIDILDIPKKDKINLDLFEDIILKDSSLLISLIYSLQLFCKIDDIDILEDGIKIDNFILNKNNYEDFSNIVLQICVREKLKLEKPPRFKAKEGTEEYEEALRRWNNLQEGRKRNAEKNTLQIYDVLNICEFYDYYIPIETIVKWTLFKIMQCYKVKIGVSNYRDNFSIYLVAGDKKIIENNHWLEQIKVGS